MAYASFDVSTKGFHSLADGGKHSTRFVNALGIDCNF